MGPASSSTLVMPGDANVSASGIPAGPAPAMQTSVLILLPGRFSSCSSKRVSGTLQTFDYPIKAS